MPEGDLTNSFMLILAPSLADRVFLAIMGPVFIGESSLCLWLLFKGVDMEKWNRRQVRSALDVQSPTTAGAAS